jgi:hypothetical protein
MMSSAAQTPVDPRFELPPQFIVADRRLAGAAHDLWRRSGGLRVADYADHSLIVADPAGAATIVSAGAAIEATFGLSAGMPLDGLTGLAAEVRAACDLIVFDPQPVPFEASLAAPGCACVLVRGVALPLTDGFDASGIPHQVQFVINWRELLDRAATTRLRREIGAALRLARPVSTKSDPFLPKSARKSLR